MGRIRKELEAPLLALQQVFDGEEWQPILTGSESSAWYGRFFGQLLIALGDDEIRHSTSETDGDGGAVSANIFTDATRIHAIVRPLGDKQAETSVSLYARRPLLEITVASAPDIAGRDTYYTWPQGATLVLRYPDRLVKVRPPRFVRDANRDEFHTFSKTLRADIAATYIPPGPGGT